MRALAVPPSPRTVVCRTGALTPVELRAAAAGCRPGSCAGRRGGVGCVRRAAVAAAPPANGALSSQAPILRHVTNRCACCCEHLSVAGDQVHSIVKRSIERICRAYMRAMARGSHGVCSSGTSRRICRWRFDILCNADMEALVKQALSVSDLCEGKLYIMIRR